MKNKNIIYTIIFIILILTTIFLAYQLMVLQKTNENIEKNYLNLKVNGLVNNTANNILNNTVNNISNNIIANNITNTIDSEVVDNQTVQTNLSNTEKAIQIAKDDWGTDSTVYFSYDHIDDSTGKYVICVRDKKTTHAKCWYYIDVTTGKFTKEL